MQLQLKFERSTKHSHLYKHEDGSNLYIRKEHLGEKPPQTLLITTAGES